MGAAEPWQDAFAARLHDLRGAILNPRRPDWDSTWRQSRDDPRFSEQVRWELDAQEACDLVPMYFSPGTKSPITLLELGLHVRGGRVIVGCPHGFWRRGNLEVVCARYAVPLVAAWEPFVAAVRSKVAR